MKHTVFLCWFRLPLIPCSLSCVCGGGRAGVGGGWWQPLWTMIGSWVCSMGVGTTVTNSHVCRCSRRVLCRNRQWKNMFYSFRAMCFSQMQKVYMYYISLSKSYPSVRSHIHPGIYTHSKSKTTFIKGDLLYPFYIPSSVDLFLNTLRYCPSVHPLTETSHISCISTSFKMVNLKLWGIKPLQLEHQRQEWKERMKQKNNKT